MSITKKVLTDIKENLQPYVGTSVQLKANKGRKKVVERTGVLESTYPNIFIVRIVEKEKERRVSFCYSDILTDNVMLTVLKDGKSMDFTY